jgi:hypothetical protein
MSLDDDIRQAIEANLTAEIGTRLKERLDQADVETKENISLRALTKDLEKERHKWELHRDAQHELMETMKAVEGRERELDLREAKLEVEERYATAARDDMMKVIEHVFKGPASHLAFDLQGNLSGLINAQGMSQSPYANLTGKIETSDDG